MKHNTKITTILISMFIITQIIGIFVIYAYSQGIDLPYGMQPPTDFQQNNNLAVGISSLFFSFLIAILVFILLMKLKAETFIRLWFFIVTVLALGLTINIILIYIIKIPSFVDYISYLALVIALPLAYIKIFRRNMIVHNSTELLIYPGIAAVFVVLLANLFGSFLIIGMVLVLLAISIYDFWAVWHSEIMQKMAKYQINTLKFFTGFFIPYASEKDKLKIKKVKDKYSDKNEKFLEKKLKSLNIKVSLAILGGGDVIFPIIAAGVFFKVYNSILAALIISAAASIALLALFIFAQKKKFYPAMPFLSVGIFIGMIIDFALHSIHLI